MSEKVDIENLKKEFKECDFYKKYRDTIYVNTLLKKIFHDTTVETKQDRLKTFEDVYNKNVEVMSDFFKLYYNTSKFCNVEIGKSMLETIYIDTDKKSIKQIDGINCLGDSLISLKRLYKHCTFDMQLVEMYAVSRKKEIFNFPSENGGINTTRATKFGDRIDYTLLDIKNYCKTGNGLMKEAYKREKTSRWFQYFKCDFKKIIDWFDVKGIFVNEKYEVYDLENGNDMILKSVNIIKKVWSKEYFKNVISKIECFNNR